MCSGNQTDQKSYVLDWLLQAIFHTVFYSQILKWKQTKW
jgi:hypothetical protein